MHGFKGISLAPCEILQFRPVSPFYTVTSRWMWWRHRSWRGTRRTSPASAASSPRRWESLWAYALVSAGRPLPWSCWASWCWSSLLRCPWWYRWRRDPRSRPGTALFGRSGPGWRCWFGSWAGSTWCAGRRSDSLRSWGGSWPSHSVYGGWEVMKIKQSDNWTGNMIGWQVPPCKVFTLVSVITRVILTFFIFSCFALHHAHTAEFFFFWALCQPMKLFYMNNSEDSDFVVFLSVILMQPDQCG